LSVKDNPATVRSARPGRVVVPRFDWLHPVTALARIVGFILLIGVFLYGSGGTSAQPALAVQSAGPTALEIRVVSDADSCPSAIEVWLTQTHDTIVALEFVLGWDRPDFARFQTERHALPALDTLLDDTATVDTSEDVVKDKRIVRPVLDYQGGLLENWEYVEARGETGLGVKVVALARVTEAPTELAIHPGDSGRLVVLPLDVRLGQYRSVDHDSAAVGFAEMATRVSTRRGSLVDSLTLIPAYLPTAPCLRSRRSEE
jgi:hypothetical protein